MAVRLTKGSSGSRLQMGAAVLSAARAADTRLVQDRLDRFEAVHRTYVDSHTAVEAAEAQLTAAQAVANARDAALDRAVDALANALVAEGHPRKNAFEAFDVPAPNALMRLRFAAAAASVHQLVPAVVRGRGVTPATTAAAQAAEEAALAVEQALVPLAKLEDEVRDARGHRHAIGVAWDAAFIALRGVARVTGREGAPGLYAALFQLVPRRTARAKPTPEGGSGGAGAPSGASQAA